MLLTRSARFDHGSRIIDTNCGRIGKKLTAEQILKPHNLNQQTFHQLIHAGHHNEAPQVSRSEDGTASLCLRHRRCVLKSSTSRNTGSESVGEVRMNLNSIMLEEKIWNNSPITKWCHWLHTQDADSCKPSLLGKMAKALHCTKTPSGNERRQGFGLLGSHHRLGEVLH